MLMATAIKLKAAGYPQKRQTRRVKPVWFKRDDDTWEDRGCVYFPTADELVVQLPEITVTTTANGVMVATDDKAIYGEKLSDALANLWIAYHSNNPEIIPQGMVQ